MKKMMVVFAVMAVVLSFGTAFAGDTDKGASNKPYNGVTNFDLGTTANCNAAPATVSKVNDDPLSNGVTVFEIRDSGAKGSFANMAEKEIMSNKNYNGVTVF